MGAIKRKAAVLCNVETLESEGRLYFWTLTTPDEVHDPKEISYRWNKLCTRLRKEYPGLKGLRVYEYHPGGHGIHIHMVVNQYLPAARMWRLAAASGFGRVDVQQWRSGAEDAAAYLTKYITKSKSEEWDGTRVYGTFGWKGSQTRQRDIEVTTPFGTIWRHMAAVGLLLAGTCWSAKVEAVEAAHLAWIRSEAENPSDWCATSLVPIRTIQTRCSPYLNEDGQFCPEKAAAVVECALWDREIRRAELNEFWEGRRQERERSWQEWNERQNAQRLAKSREWSA